MRTAVDAYIFDLDGTLSDVKHRLHHLNSIPPDWARFFSACFEDPLIEPVAALVLNLFEGGNDILYVSGRSDECRELTHAWIKKHGLPLTAPVYMRKEGDHRPDDQVKSELMDQIIAEGYRPLMVFDDRNSVVKMWRARGIPCCQVAEGNF